MFKMQLVILLIDVIKITEIFLILFPSENYAPRKVSANFLWLLTK
jgi:hypothetical protein